MAAFLLTKDGQSLGVNNFTVTTHANANNGAVMMGGENESGVVTFGAVSTSVNSTIALGRDLRLYANAGGTAVFNSRFTGGSISKIGRGTVVLNGNVSGDFTSTNLLVSGGTLKMDYTTQNNRRMADTATLNLNGGSLQFIGNAAANTTQTITNVNNGGLNLRAGSTEVLVQSAAGRTTTLNLGRRASTTDGANINRTLGSTVNFVEVHNGGTASITLAAKSSNWVTGTVLPWATYSNAERQASDFAMINATGNTIEAIARNAAEYENNVATWGAKIDPTFNVSENGDQGFYGTLDQTYEQTVNTVRFDAASDSILDLGTQTLNLTSGALLVSSNVGSNNKTITGGTLGFANNAEFIIHHYGSGKLTINSALGTASAAPSLVVIAGQSVTNATTLANWATAANGQVLLTSDSSLLNKEMKWYLTGSVLSVSNINQLGKVAFAAATNDAFYMNGGALRWTGGSESLDNFRNITVGGDGGVLDIVDGDAVFLVKGNLISENSYLFMNGSASANSHVGGDLIKMGAGTLALEGGSGATEDGNNPAFTGMIDVREGTLRLAGTSATTSGTLTVTTLGTNRSAVDGTVFRNGTNLELYYTSGTAIAGGAEWRIEEWLRFEGNNTIRFGQTPVTGVLNRTTHLNGVIDVQGSLTVDVAAGMTARFNQSSGGYLTGTGDITKVGLGALEFRDNNVLWSGGLHVHEGTMRLYSTGLVGGTGTAAVTLGSMDYQGIAELQLYSESGFAGLKHELFQDINVVYNALQTKRISFGADAAAGAEGYFHGDVIMGDNLGLYMIQGGRFVGGSYNFAYFTGDFRDDLINNRSGNITVHVDDTNSGTANNQQVGEGVGYFVFRGDNSAWTGDISVGFGSIWDQDEITVLRLENEKALTALNDVYMNGSSKLQVAGNEVTIGSLHTNNGPAGTTTSGSANDGLGNFQGVSGSSAWIENASEQEGTLVVTQTTPVTTEALWDVHFRDGELPSHYYNNYTVGAALNVVKAGNGWATMTLDNDYTGTTTVRSGVLQVGKAGQGDTGAYNAAGTTVQTGATISGTGYIQGGLTVDANGLLKPGDVAGNAMGTLTINGNAGLASGSITQLQIQQATYNNTNYLSFKDVDYAGWVNGIPTDEYSDALSDPVLASQHDKIVVNGTLTWEAGSRIEIVNAGYTATAGDVFNLFDWFAVSGAVGTGPNIRYGTELGLDLTLPELGNGFKWETSLFNSHGILVVVAPEPGRALLLLLGLAALVLRRRRR
jgi:autotransporter-associated beta strand protein